MMYLITYTLNPIRPVPDQLVVEIQKAPQWWHYMDNTWLVAGTPETATQIWNRIAKNGIQTTDRVLVVRIMPGADRQGWQDENAWKWIRDHEYE